MESEVKQLFKLTFGVWESNASGLKSLSHNRQGHQVTVSSFRKPGEGQGYA